MTTQAPAPSWAQVKETTRRLLVSWGGEGFDERRVDFRATFPRHGEAIYCAEKRAWSLPPVQKHRLEEWLASWFADDAIDWKGRPREPAAPPGDRALADAYSLLCLTSAAPVELIASARRILSKTAHPDHAGGDELAQRRINHAYDTIMAAQQRHEDEEVIS